MWALFVGYFFVIGIIQWLTRNRINKNVFIFFIFLGMFLFQGVRGERVGIDLPVYQETFNHFGTTSFSVLKQKNDFHGMEIGFVIFSKLCYSLFNGSWQLYIILISLIINSAICVFISKQSSEPWIACLAYLFIGNYIFSFSALRQSLAIAICLFAYCSLCKKHYIRTLLLIYLASTFHFSAFVFLLVFIAPEIKFNDGLVTLYTILLFALMILANILLPPIIRLLLPRYIKYLNSETSFGMFSIFMIICFCTSYYFARSKGTIKGNSVLGMSLLAAIMQSFGNISTLTGRITMYFTPFLCVAISNIDDVPKNKQIKRIAQFLFILVLGIGVFASDLLNGYLNVSPYHFFWGRS